MKDGDVESYHGEKSQQRKAHCVNCVRDEHYNQRANNCLHHRRHEYERPVRMLRAELAAINTAYAKLLAERGLK